MSSGEAVHKLSDFSIEEIERMCRTFLRERFIGNISAIVRAKDESKYYAVNAEFATFLQASPTLAALTMANPVYMFPMLNWTLRRVQREVFDELQRSLSPVVCSEKPHVRFRVPLLDQAFLFETKALPRSREVGNFVCLQGTVIRTGLLKTLEFERAFECTKCGYVFTVQADVEQYHMFPEPVVCPAMSEPPCKARKFRYVDGTAKHKDYQEIKVQEKMHNLQQGQMPKSMIIILEDDLVDSCKGGDDVILTGVVMRRWRPLQAQLRCDVAIVVAAHGLYVQNEEDRASVITPEQRVAFEAHWRLYRDERGAELLGRDRILHALCPTAHGMYLVKLAMLLVLIGGVETIDTRGTKVRGESHLLLIGDPGVAKSQFLGFAAKIAPRSVCTSGVGTTNAGLTVAAVRDQSGDWVLEAGALVLSDGGVCCIDEFAQIRAVDRAAIHEAMEQQTISVAKAGLVTKLQTRCTIIAACNPKGRYDTGQSLEDNVGIASPLLSRFDLIFLLKDDHDAHWDDEVADFVLHEHMAAATSNAGGVSFASMSSTSVVDIDPSPRADSEWTFELLQAYIQHVRRMYRPSMSPEAREVLLAYYRRQRQFGMRAVSRTTIRMLESLLRLSQAHARLMSRNVVALIDAVVVVLLVEASQAGAAIRDFVSPVRTVFADDPDGLFRTQLVPQVLEMLELSNLCGAPPPSQAPPPNTQNATQHQHQQQHHQQPQSSNMFDMFVGELNDEELNRALDFVVEPVVIEMPEEPHRIVPPPMDLQQENDDHGDDEDNGTSDEKSAYSQQLAQQGVADNVEPMEDDRKIDNKNNKEDEAAPPPPLPPTISALDLGDALARVRSASSLASHSNPNSQAGGGESSRGSRKRLLNDDN